MPQLESDNVLFMKDLESLSQLSSGRKKIFKNLPGIC
jgi:hypothetical protein